MLRAGRKWSVKSAIKGATTRLRHKDLVGKVCVSGHGHGYGKDSQQRWDGAGRSVRRTMIGEELRAMEEEKRMARAQNQGAWLNWEDVASRNISWNMLWKMEPLRIRFLIRATYDQLLTPTNLVKWGITESEKCSLCDRPCNLEHILSSCRTALTQGRFTWRHNKVLEKLAHHLELKRSLANKATQEKQIQFVKAGRNRKWQIYQDKPAY